MNDVEIVNQEENKETIKEEIKTIVTERKEKEEEEDSPFFYVPANFTFDFRKFK